MLHKPKQILYIKREKMEEEKKVKTEKGMELHITKKRSQKKVSQPYLNK